MARSTGHNGRSRLVSTNGPDLLLGELHDPTVVPDAASVHVGDKLFPRPAGRISPPSALLTQTTPRPWRRASAAMSRCPGPPSGTRDCPGGDWRRRRGPGQHRAPRGTGPCPAVGVRRHEGCRGLPPRSACTPRRQGGCGCTPCVPTVCSPGDAHHAASPTREGADHAPGAEERDRRCGHLFRDHLSAARCRADIRSFVIAALADRSTSGLVLARLTTSPAHCIPSGPAGPAPAHCALRHLPAGEPAAEWQSDDPAVVRKALRRLATYPAGYPLGEYSRWSRGAPGALPS